MESDGRAIADDPVEVALAAALVAASQAGQWHAVAAVTRELEARRCARTGVINLEAERAKRR
jgi:hypothetical protein